MAYYFMASIRMEDEAVYQQYIDRAGAVFSRFKGEYLAVDNQPTVLEGEWPYARAVLIRFPTRADFEAWYQSPEYREILAYRLSGARCDSIGITGKD